MKEERLLKISQAALVAATLMLAAPATGALAQDTAPAVNEHWNEVFDAGFSYSLSIPTVLAVGSSMSEAALRDALTGKFLEHADELSALTATSITIPEISVTYSTSSTYGSPVSQTISYKDIVFANIKDGVAATATLGSGETISPEMTQTIGTTTLKDFDIGATLAFFTGGGEAGSEMQTIYSSSTGAGQKITSAVFSCEIGESSSGGLRMRPLKLSFARFIEISNKMAVVDGQPAKVSPEDLRDYVGFIADLFHAFEYDPGTFGGFSCSGSGPDGRPFTVSLGSAATDGYLDGALRAITLKDFKLTADDGNVSLGSTVFKPLDFKPWIKALESNIDEVNPEWLSRNWRLLVPAWDGFAFSGLAVDVPDTNVPGGRVNVKVADFDLSLSNYINGIPSQISSFAKEVDVPFPETSTDPQIGMLMAAGMKGVNLGYDLNAHWDAATKSIVIGNIGVSGKDLGSLAVAANIGNAAEQIFALDTDAAMASLMGVTVKNLKIDLTDTGMSDIAIPIIAGQQGADPVSFRKQMAGTAEGVVIALLGSTDSARQLGAALSNFINGTAGSVSISVVAKDPLGLPIPLLMQASQNPQLLGDQVTITGSGAP